MNDCSFCSKDIDTVQEIYRTNLVRIIYPKKPIIIEHAMVAPLRHVKRLTELTNEERVDILYALDTISSAFKEKANKPDFNAFFNNGPAAGQTVPHLHFHVFGRSKDEAVNPYDILNNLRAKPVAQLTKAEVRSRVNKLKSGIHVYNSSSY